jgi:hypothetical protein
MIEFARKLDSMDCTVRVGREKRKAGASSLVKHYKLRRLNPTIPGHFDDHQRGLCLSDESGRCIPCIFRCDIHCGEGGIVMG